MSITIEDRAYAKIMLHCLKHTSKDCYGILLGSDSDDKVTVTDAVPLFHDRVFAPQLEISLKFIEIFLEKEKDYKVVGIYENLLINNQKDTQQISPFATLILDNLNAKKFKFPYLFEISYKDGDVVGNEQPKPEILFKINRYVLQQGQSNFSWELINSLYEQTDSQFDCVKRLINDNKLPDIIDFDDHFEDVNLDWRNNFVDAYLK